MTHDCEPSRDPDAQHAPEDRYAGIETEAGFVVYDTENTAAWIQSEASVAPEEMV